LFLPAGLAAFAGGFANTPGVPARRPPISGALPVAYLPVTTLSCPEGIMVQVTIGENDRLDWALKQFRRKLIRSGLMKDMKKRRFYEKPSEARKRKAAAARRRGTRAAHR
jgi:small subunit ribosomal protein S21